MLLAMLDMYKKDICGGLLGWLGVLNLAFDIRYLGSRGI